MKFSRSSGILLHPTSLPSRFGIGDMGSHAYEFADFLAASGMKLWQVLPLNPTGYGDSPYQCFSAFAGNPLLIDLQGLQEKGLLAAADLCEVPAFPENNVDFGRVIDYKFRNLRQAAQNFLQAPPDEGFRAFCDSNASWLEDYALFMACKNAHGGIAWTRWDESLRRRAPAAIKESIGKLTRDIEILKYWQYEFFQQWSKLKAYCHDRGILIVGDIPIYVAHDSAEVWAHPELFQLDENGNPAVVSGVPPDYFSATGQLWGNPIYRWDVLARSGYQWWIDRFRAALALFNIVRLDHFRGFEAYWQIPGGDSTAINGRWVKGPGADLFRALQTALGDLPIIAENLGVITPEVEALRKQFGFPGMSLLQFAFGTDPQGPSFRPHNYTRDLVAYSGGHDNDTTVGWWTSTGAGDSTRTAQDIRREREFAKAYLRFQNEPVNWIFIQTVLASVADLAIVPLQDVLGLGNEARMNLPGKVSGNWRWRYQSDALRPELSDRLKALTTMYDR